MGNKLEEHFRFISERTEFVNEGEAGFLIVLLQKWLLGHDIRLTYITFAPILGHDPGLS
jgi:hypothetical protein